jgi:hypothetical protein
LATGLPGAEACSKSSRAASRVASRNLPPAGGRPTGQAAASPRTRALSSIVPGGHPHGPTFEAGSPAPRVPAEGVGISGSPCPHVDKSPWAQGDLSQVERPVRGGWGVSTSPHGDMSTSGLSDSSLGGEPSLELVTAIPGPTPGLAPEGGDLTVLLRRSAIGSLEPQRRRISSGGSPSTGCHGLSGSGRWGPAGSLGPFKAKGEG